MGSWATLQLVLNNVHKKLPRYSDPCGSRGRCRIGPPRFLAVCRTRRLNQGSLLLYFRLFVFFVLYLVVYFPMCSSFPSVL